MFPSVSKASNCNGVSLLEVPKELIKKKEKKNRFIELLSQAFMNLSSASYQQEGGPRVIILIIIIIITNEKSILICYLVLGRQAVGLEYISLQREHHTR